MLRRLPPLFFGLCGAAFAGPSHFTIHDGGLYRTGETTPFVIVEANSPENQIESLTEETLDELQSYGVNTLYTVLYGGDDTSLYPWTCRNCWGDRDETRIARWRATARMASARGFVWHVQLEEEEEDHHDRWKQEQLIRVAIDLFATHPTLWGLGEESQRSDEETRWRAALIRSLDPYNGPLTLLNRWDEPRTAFHVGRAYVDILAWQGDRQNVLTLATEARANGFVFYWAEDSANGSITGSPTDNLFGNAYATSSMWEILSVQGDGMGFYAGLYHDIRDFDRSIYAASYRAAADAADAYRRGVRSRAAAAVLGASDGGLRKQERDQPIDAATVRRELHQ